MPPEGGIASSENSSMNDQRKPGATSGPDPAVALIAGIILGGLAYYLYKELEK